MLKSTLSAFLIILFVVCWIRIDSFFPPEAHADTQTSPSDSNEQDRRFLEQYHEKQFDLEDRLHKARQAKNEREVEKAERQLQKLHRQIREHHRDHSHDAHRDREQQIDQHKHRIQKMHLAAEHLEEAGLSKLADQVHRQAKQQEIHLREQIERAMHHEHRSISHHETHELLHQLRNEVRELKIEVQELKEVISDRSSDSEE
ncbi:hypothetical protein [Gimesia aquarii]|uniref:Uncharacterized protein n=1 Tax=Gimesia aquarii TaxID=2527964 RepID=A0A517WRK1_9PLAN|nr:hypothetical protein [Gimesia aquarii]QDU07879.1 hypothetical protein V202x_12400 [Gimesia aquarii]